MANIKDNAQNTGNTSNEGVLGRENFKNYDVEINSLEKDVLNLKENLNKLERKFEEAKIDSIKSDLDGLKKVDYATKDNVVEIKKELLERPKNNDITGLIDPKLNESYVKEKDFEKNVNHLLTQKKYIEKDWWVFIVGGFLFLASIGLITFSVNALIDLNKLKTKYELLCKDLEKKVKNVNCLSTKE